MQGQPGSFYAAPRPNGQHATSGAGMNGGPPPQPYGAPPPPAQGGLPGPAPPPNGTAPYPPTAQMQQMKIGSLPPGPGAQGARPPAPGPSGQPGVRPLPGAVLSAGQPQPPSRLPQPGQHPLQSNGPAMLPGQPSVPRPQYPPGPVPSSVPPQRPPAPLAVNGPPLASRAGFPAMPGVAQHPGARPQGLQQAAPVSTAPGGLAAPLQPQSTVPRPPAQQPFGGPGAPPHPAAQRPAFGPPGAPVPSAVRPYRPPPSAPGVVIPGGPMPKPAQPTGAPMGAGPPPGPPQVGGYQHPPTPHGLARQAQAQGQPHMGVVGGMPPPPTAFGAGGPPGQGAPPSFSATPMSPPGHGPMGPRPPAFGPPLEEQAAGGGSVGSGGRLRGKGGLSDTAQMPRPHGTSLPTQVFETRRENTHNPPPPSDVPIVVRDKGSAGPRHMRTSLNYVPLGPDVLKTSTLPFVVVVNALAATDPGDSPIPVIDPGPQGPLRCSQCKAYVCPFMRWSGGGMRMECCFCKATTEAPAEYAGRIEMDGARYDKSGRPDLAHGSVEYTVGGEYQVRPPAPPTFLFLIEVSAAAVASGATAAVCASLALLLDDLPGGDATRVGIATFDSQMHYYAVRPGGRSMQMLVVPDATEPFTPLGPASVLNLRQHREELSSLLSSIPEMFAGTQAGESAGGAALKAGVEALKAGVGGRLVAFISSLPHKGVMPLRPREAGRPPSERDALEVMVPEGKEYAALATDAAEHQVSVDIFAVTQGYVDLATLSTLCTGTSGSLYRYNPFTPGADGPRLHNDLRWALMRPQGLEAVARLRVSKGLAVDNYVGAFYRRNATDLHFPALSCEHSIAAKIVIEERLQEGTEVYLQYALLYTATDGTRRVRVHTMALPVTRTLNTVFRGADLEAYLVYVASKVSQQLPGRTLTACKDVLNKAVVDVLASYRKNCGDGSNDNKGALILPETLKLLPLYILGLQKLPCFRTDARADSRAVWMARFLSMPADRIVAAVHPRLLPLHTLLSRPANAPSIPEKLPPTAAKLDPDGIFLMENGFDAYIYVGPAVPPAQCAELLGVPSPEAVNPVQFSGPPALDTPLSQAVCGLLDEIRRQRRGYMHVRLVYRGHPQEAGFVAALVEDRNPTAGLSYVEYLCHLHRLIQNKLT